jgi:hypothetical protein
MGVELVGALREECRLRVFENRVQKMAKWGALWSLLLTKYYLGDSNKDKWEQQGTWHVWEVGEVHIQFWWGDQRVRDHLEDRGKDRRTLLKWIFKNWDGGHGLDWYGSTKGQVASSCECRNEHSFSIKGKNFLTGWGHVYFSGRTLLHLVS